MFTDNIFQSIVGGFQTINGIELFFNKAQPNLKCNGAIHVALALSLYSFVTLLSRAGAGCSMGGSVALAVAAIFTKS